MRSTPLALLLALWPLAGAAGQQPAPGQRVRVIYCEGRAPDQVDPLVSTDCQLDTGTLRRITADSVVWLDEQDATRTLAVASLTRLDVSRGRSPLVLRTLALGAVAALLGANAGRSIGYSQNDPEGRGKDVGMLVGGSVGLIAGVAVGLLWRDERWQPVPLDGMPGPVPPAGGRRGIGLRLRF